MKGVFSRIPGILIAAIFVALITVFIFNLRQEQASSTGNTQGQSGYPPPENAVAQPAAYPGPSSNSIATPDNLPEPQLITYQDEAAGYSFEYQSNMLLIDGKNAGEPFNHVRLYLGSGGNLLISILKNPEQLLLEQFLKTDFSYYSQQPDDTWKTADFNEHTLPLTVDDQPGVLIERNETTSSITGLAKYVAFIAYGEYVIQAVLEPTETATPNEPPAETVEKFNEIINSFQFEQ